MQRIEKIKDQYVGAECSLDGKPAIIAGRLKDFAIVGQLKSPGLYCEFAWQTVERIMLKKQGQFSSEVSK